MLVSTHRHFFYVITFRIFSFEHMKETIKSKTLRQQATFSCSPLELYEILMNSKKHGEITGGKAKISNKITGQFEVFDGYVRGYNIELVPGKRIRFGVNIEARPLARTRHSFDKLAARVQSHHRSRSSA